MKAKDVTLVSLFSPEHGIRGQVDERVASSKDETTGLTIHSLYDATRRPTDAMLTGIDTLVVDLQDIGARFYTYPATTAYVLEEAAKRRIRVVVLDRPNPIDGFDIEGPMQDASSIGFNGYVPMPIRHGLTLGELARLFNGEKSIGADLTVVPMKNWRRDDWFDATGLAWANPSPNMRNMVAATVYPGIGALEGTNVSVGQGHRHAVRAARARRGSTALRWRPRSTRGICPASASIRSRSRRRPARSSAASRVTASSSSSPTAIG